MVQYKTRYESHVAASVCRAAAGAYSSTLAHSMLETGVGGVPRAYTQPTPNASLPRQSCSFVSRHALWRQRRLSLIALYEKRRGVTSYGSSLPLCWGLPRRFAGYQTLTKTKIRPRASNTHPLFRMMRTIRIGSTPWPHDRSGVDVCPITTEYSFATGLHLSIPPNI